MSFSFRDLALSFDAVFFPLMLLDTFLFFGGGALVEEVAAGTGPSAAGGALFEVAAGTAPSAAEEQ